MLSDLLSENLIQLDVDAADWKDAIYKATAPMVESGVVTEGYVEDIIKGKEELGPYFVLTEHVALPHARPECGALQSAIGIVTLKNPVEFGSEANDPVKYLFPLAAKDSDAHLSALQSLVELLADPDFFNQLDAANTPADVMNLVHAKERN